MMFTGFRGVWFNASAYEGSAARCFTRDARVLLISQRRMPPVTKGLPPVQLRDMGRKFDQLAFLEGQPHLQSVVGKLDNL